MRARVLALSLLAVTGDMSGSIAQAFDCSKAANTVEKLICSNADLARLDGQMASAYSAALAALAPVAKSQLVTAQRRWISGRQTCGEWDAAMQVGCIRERTGERLSYLRPMGESGKAGALAPALLLRVGRPGFYAINVQLLKFAPADTPGKRIFNAEVQNILSSVPDRGETTEGKLVPTFDALMQVYSLSPGFVSAGVSLDEFTGSAHGIHSTRYINVDLAAANALAFADVFSVNALKPLVESCRRQIVATKDSRREPGDTAPTELSDEYQSSIRDAVAGLDRWSFSDGTATIHFDAYAVGAYAEGPFTCTFDRQTLLPYVRGSSPIFK